jgi:hypothetical protein
MRKLILLPVAVLFGCGFSGPESGTWQIDSETEISNTCNTSDTGIAADTGGVASSLYILTVDAEDANLFTILDSEDPNGEPTRCTRDGKSFECDAWTMEMDYSKWGMDSIVSFAISTGGDFTSTTTMTIDGVLTMACEGADCESVGAENCETVWEMDGSFVE